MTRTSLVLFMAFLVGCKRDNVDPLPPSDPDEVVVNDPELFSSGLFSDYGNINIRTIANGNSWDIFVPNFVRDISGQKFAYCHPDVEYFENGFHGYKFWMTFTPYFGSLGASGNAIYYENPSIVVSNDGLNWEEPNKGINPIQLRPSFKDGIIKNNKDTLQGYWSDTDLLFNNNQLELFYRGSVISPTCFKRICSQSLNNDLKLSKPAVRIVVKQISKNGVDWAPPELLYSSNTPETLNDNDVLSPSFVAVKDQLISYEVLFNTGVEGYKEGDNSFVLKRISNNGLDYSDFYKSKIIHFDNKPWKELNHEYSPWHLQASYVDGYYFLCLAVGKVKSYTSDVLYLAYSKDGDSFKVFPTPIVKNSVYRSCVFPLSSDKTNVEFGSVIGMKSGQFKYRKFKVNKMKLKKMLG